MDDAANDGVRRAVLVRASFDAVRAASPGDAILLDFYDRLFEAAPEVRDMFSVSVNAQATKLLNTLALTLDSLDDVEELDLTLQALGARHAMLGVTEGQYAVVTDMLMATFADALGAEWQPEHDTAWRSLLAEVSDAMLKGAEAIGHSRA